MRLLRRGNTAPVDHGHPRGEPVGLLQVLGGQHDGGAVGDELADHRPDLVAAVRVEAGRRLVEEEHRRPVHERRRKVDPAAHAARVGAHWPVGRLAQLEALEQLARARRGRPARQVDEPSDQTQVLASGQIAVDGRILSRQTDPLPHGLRLADDVETEHLRPTRVGQQHRRQHADGGRLAGPVRAEQTEHRPGGDLEVDARQRLDRAEPLAQALDADRRLRHPARPRRAASRGHGARPRARFAPP
jgi:hypothetical protein